MRAVADQRAITAADFQSVLFPPGFDRELHRTSHDALHDLALDQVVERLVTAESDGDLAAAFRSPLSEAQDVRYRQAVFQDLEDPAVSAVLSGFSDGLRVSGNYRRSAVGSHDRHQAARLQLTAVQRYVAAVLACGRDLPPALDGVGGGSPALRGFLTHLQEQVVPSPRFTRLQAESDRLEAQWRSVRYDVWIRGTRVTVAPFDDEPDLTAEIVAAFERFSQGAARDYRVPDPQVSFDHVQGWILGSVAELFPDLFAALQAFLTESGEYVDAVVGQFVHELRFYLTYLDYLQPLQDAGLPLCYPTVSATDKGLQALDTYDLALARSLVEQQADVVLNDFTLSGPERILVVSGPNQGGKSTAARTFGQLHHLAAVGCPVPGRKVRAFLPDCVLTHFEREERLDTLEGRLGNEVHRIHDLLADATGASVIVLNEMFTSTALQDARLLTAEVLQRISDLDALCVCVTFIDELSRLNPKTVSMVSTIDPHDPAIRTFKVERKRADGRAYAVALARKHGLTFDAIEDRLEDRRHELRQGRGRGA